MCNAATPLCVCVCVCTGTLSMNAWVWAALQPPPVPPAPASCALTLWSKKNSTVMMPAGTSAHPHGRTLQSKAKVGSGSSHVRFKEFEVLKAGVVNPGVKLQHPKPTTAIWAAGTSSRRLNVFQLPVTSRSYTCLHATRVGMAHSDTPAGCFTQYDIPVTMATAMVLP